jgi:hypothetical protein
MGNPSNSAGYLHGITNAVNRINHPITSANLAMMVLNEMGMGEIVTITGAIGNRFFAFKYTDLTIPYS